MVDPAEPLADGDRDPIEFRHDRENVLVGYVIPDKKRAAAGKRIILHQLADRGRFVETGLLDFDHGFTREKFNRYRRQASADRRNSRMNREIFVRYQTVMQSKRISLVFDDNAGIELRDGGKPALYAGGERRKP